MIEIFGSSESEGVTRRMTMGKFDYVYRGVNARELAIPVANSTSELSLMKGFRRGRIFQIVFLELFSFVLSNRSKGGISSGIIFVSREILVHQFSSTRNKAA